MSQNNLSRLENPEYGKHTISSLKRIADALDVALVVRLVPFSQFIDWLSGTPRLDKGLSVSALAVPNFARDAGLQERSIGSVVSIAGYPETAAPQPNDDQQWAPLEGKRAMAVDQHGAMKKVSGLCALRQF